jgi:phosphatidylglycerol:prolipoprotein diacylglycerol transferase
MNAVIAQVLTILAFFVGGAVFYFEARRKKLATTGIGKLTIVALCGGLIGAKVTEIIFGRSAPSALLILDPASGGRTIIGGVIVGWIAVEIAKWRLGIRRSTGDMFALALPAGEVVGRIGCHFSGCCYGIEANLPWSTFQHEAFRHPTQLYLAVSAAVTFFVLKRLRDQFPEGSLFALYLLCFATYRFIIEFFRVTDVLFWSLSTAQWVSIELAVSSILLLAYRWRKAATKEFV